MTAIPLVPTFHEELGKVPIMLRLPRSGCGLILEWSLNCVAWDAWSHLPSHSRSCGDHSVLAIRTSLTCRPGMAPLTC